MFTLDVKQQHNNNNTLLVLLCLSSNGFYCCSAFKAWLVYTRRSINLRRLEKSFTRRKNQKTLQNHWYMMKTRFHYCQELTNMADKVIRDKNETLMRQALGHWEFRLQVCVVITTLMIKFWTTVELQWLKQAWDHENWFQSKVVPASQCTCRFLY